MAATFETSCGLITKQQIQMVQGLILGRACYQRDVHQRLRVSREILFAQGSLFLRRLIFGSFMGAFLSVIPDRGMGSEM